jgi:hypothetical protein
MIGGGVPMLTVQQEDENEDEDELTVQTEGLEIADISLREIPSEI